MSAPNTKTAQKAAMSSATAKKAPAKRVTTKTEAAGVAPLPAKAAFVSRWAFPIDWSGVGVVAGRKK